MCGDEVTVDGKQLAQRPTASNLFVNKSHFPQPCFLLMDRPLTVLKTQLNKFF